MRKKIIIALVAILILAIPALALAEPSESPSPSESSSSSVSPSSSASTDAFTVLKMESTGPNVTILQLRLRDLGFFCYRATGSYKALTREGVIRFQEQNKLDVDGTVGENTFKKLFSKVLSRSKLPESYKVVSGPADNKKQKTYGEAADWATVSSAFSNGTTATITDFNSGITFTVKRTGGQNHAEVETVEKTDYTNFLKAFGGAPTWEKRAVTVTVGGVNYSASLFGWPHGEDNTADNGMDGHTCVYFSGSTSEVLGLSDIEHNDIVKKAVQNQ